MVLLTISLVVGFINQFGAFNVSTILSMIVDAYVLQLIYKVRNGK